MAERGSLGRLAVAWRQQRRRNLARSRSSWLAAMRRASSEMASWMEARSSSGGMMKEESGLMKVSAVGMRAGRGWREVWWM